MGLDMYLFSVKKGDERFIKDIRQGGTYFQTALPYESYTLLKEDTDCVQKNGMPGPYYWSKCSMPFTVKLPKKRKNTQGYKILGYWRKANSIHNWFVNAVQNGNDDCGWHEVSKLKLLELLEICKTVIKTGKTIQKTGDSQFVIDAEIAERLLPTKTGLCFGNLSYNSLYVGDLLNTIYIIEKTLKTVDFSKETVFYDAWW